MVSVKSENVRFLGIGASPGIAIGTVRVADRSRVNVVEFAIVAGEVPAETERFQRALEEAKSELTRIKDQLAATKGPEHLYVIDTHLLILSDSMLSRETIGFIEGECINAEAAL